MATLKEDLQTALADVDHLKTQLSTAENEVKQLKAGKEKAETDLSAAQGEVSKLKADLEAANGKVTSLEGEKAQLSEEIKELKGKSDRADDRGREALARNGVKTTATKDTPKAATTTAEDPTELWERYRAASPAEKAKLRAEKGEELEAAAAAYEESK